MVNFGFFSAGKLFLNVETRRGKNVNMMLF